MSGTYSPEEIDRLMEERAAKTRCIRCGVKRQQYSQMCMACHKRDEHEKTIARAIKNGEPLAPFDRIGIGRRFSPQGKVPSFDDVGLAGPIAANPLPAGGLFVCGPVGSHKSHLLAARTADAYTRGWESKFISWSDILLNVRGSFKRDGRSEREIVNDLIDLDYLAIDDMPTGRVGRKETAFSHRVAYAVLDGRYGRGSRCTTDISTNLLLEEMDHAFDERIVRRIKEQTTVYTMLLETKPR